MGIGSETGFRIAKQLRAYALLQEQAPGWLAAAHWKDGKLVGLFRDATPQELRRVANEYEEMEVRMMLRDALANKPGSNNTQRRRRLS